MSEVVPIDEVDMDYLDMPIEPPSRRANDYRVLREAGFPPMSASSIVIEAERGDELAKYYLARAKGRRF